jgi:hypothetical protein
VQDALLGLYRRWPALADQDRALGYVRSSVLNGCGIKAVNSWDRTRQRLPRVRQAGRWVRS